jgi:hypothetical protein
MRRITTILAGLALAASAILFTAGPASASPCQIPGGQTITGSLGHKACVRVDITYCLVNTTRYWFSWWIQDTIDPGSDADRAELWVRWPSTGTWNRHGYDTNSADWNPASGYHLASVGWEGAAGSVQVKGHFSEDQPNYYRPITINYLSTGSC